MSKDEIITYVQKQYSWIDMEDLDITYQRAFGAVLYALFPYNESQEEIPERLTYLVLDAMLEIIDLGNMRNYTSYKENGVSWTRTDTSQLNCLKNVSAYVGY